MFKFASAALVGISALALAPSSGAASNGRSHNYVVLVQHCRQHGDDYSVLPVRRTLQGGFDRAGRIALNWRGIRGVGLRNLSGTWVAHYALVAFEPIAAPPAPAPPMRLPLQRCGR